MFLFGFRIGFAVCSFFLSFAFCKCYGYYGYDHADYGKRSNPYKYNQYFAENVCENDKSVFTAFPRRERNVSSFTSVYSMTSLRLMFTYE